MPNNPEPGAHHPHHPHHHHHHTLSGQGTEDLTRNLREFFKVSEDTGTISHQQLNKHDDAIDSVSTSIAHPPQFAHHIFRSQDIVAYVANPPQRIESLLLPKDLPLHYDNQELYRKLFRIHSDPPEEFIGIFGEISASFSKKYEATFRTDDWDASLMWRHLGKMVRILYVEDSQLQLTYHPIRSTPLRIATESF